MPARLLAMLLLLTAAAATPAHAVTLRVTSPDDAGPGTLRDAIEQANAAPQAAHIEVALGAEGLIEVMTALPEVSREGTTLDGGGATLRQGEGCARQGGKPGCDGIAVTGAHVVVSNLIAAGFTFDGVSVRGSKARNVRVENVVAFDNLDDGVGVSDDAGPVLVERCLLMGNGFRTKGKGLLVFDRARATLRDSVVLGNRDGVTVTKGAHAHLERSIIVGSFDKGLGAGDGRITGSDVQILANGTGEYFEESVPNGDGLRVSLGSSVELARTRIDGNGDSGVVALDGSRVELRGGSIAVNGGYGVLAGREARVTARDMIVDRNAKGPVSLTEGGKADLR